MKVIAKPNFTVSEVFSACISTVTNLTLKNQLADCIEILEKGEKDFNNKFKRCEIYKITPQEIVFGNIGKEQMKTVYDYRMVNKGMSGNLYYNKIKSSAPYGRCPLCSIREVDTLDHYLPKSKYPIYSVTPINLIPACIKCNKGKHIDYPKTSEEQTLHPYYDNIENEPWLEANVLQTDPIAFEYYVNAPKGWTQIMKDRTANHFSSFNLDELFSSHANEELRGSKKQLVKLYKQDPQLLIDHLKSAYESKLELGLNSWRAVMYRVLLHDSWFCSGGVLL